MANAEDPRQRAEYHLDLSFDDGRILLNVDGAEGPAVRSHVAEVARAAEQCGFRVVVTARGGKAAMSA